jgi:ferrochelatase
MRHSAPFIAEAVAQCAEAGAQEIVGIILAPQQSAFIRNGYEKDLMEAAATHGLKARLSAPWPAEPHFISFLAGEIKKYPGVPVIFTTHSLPKRVVENEPQYEEQLRQTVEAVHKELPNIESYSAYQSAGHTPEEWLKPDLTDILDELAQKKVPQALIVPIQFVSDHLEILYDLDVAGRQQCEERGLPYLRTAMPGTDPLFIEALKSIAVGAL